jgi:hypothetical protein
LFARLKSFCIVALLAGGGALLPDLGHSDNTTVVQINQGNLGIQICGAACVQVLQQYNIAVVFVSQGPDFAPALGAAYISSAAYDFGAVVHAKARDFTLTNTSSSQPLLVAAIGMSGANPDDFTTSTNCGILLRPGQQCGIHVVFAPRDLGARSAVLAVRDSAADSPQKVSLAGTGVEPSLSPDSIGFGSVAIGTTSTAKTATLRNPGTDALTLQSVAIEGPNASEFHDQACATVPAGGTCAISISFQPADGGGRAASLVVTHDGLGGPRHVALAGTGVPLLLSPAAIDFGSVLVGSATQPSNIAVENHGASSVLLNSVGFTSGNASDFTYGTTCGLIPATLLAGSRCTIQVTFKPAATGQRGSSLAIHYTAGGTGFDAAAVVGGTGIQPGLALSVGSLDFGAVRVGQPVTQSIIVSNPGTAPTHLGSITLTGGSAGDFSHAGSCDSLAGDLAPSTSCQVDLTFKPRSAGVRSAVLSFSDNAPGAPHVVALTGRGTTPPPRPYIPPPTAAPQPQPISAGPPAGMISTGTVSAGGTEQLVSVGEPGNVESAAAAVTTQPVTNAAPVTGTAAAPKLTAPCPVSNTSPISRIAAIAVWLASLALLFALGFLAARRWRRNQLPPPTVA